MPKSRSSRRTHHIHDHARVRARARGGLRSRPSDVEPCRWQVILAEAAGDAPDALRLLAECGTDEDRWHRADLAAMVRHRDHAPPWLVGRWLTRQAFRWLRLRGDDRYERALVLSLQGTYWSRADLTVADLPPAYARVLADDWVTREIALYGYQALDDFLDGVADRSLVGAAGNVRSWVRLPLRTYRLGESDEDVLHATDVATGATHEVLDLGTGTFYPEGSYVLGRLVPIGDDADLFESLPLLVDERTALDIATARPPHGTNPLPWAPLLTRAIDQGRLPRMPGAGLRTSIVSDAPVVELPDDDWEPPPDRRWTELVEAGLDDEMAGWVQVLEEGLRLLPRQPAAVATVADSLERILPSDVAMDVVRRRLTGTEIADGWEALAVRVDGELRRTCVELASAARARG